MINKRILVLALILQSITLSEVYNDRLRIYIDNSAHDFSVDEKTGLSNNIELNRMMEKLGAVKLKQWLSNARPTDRDGDTCNSWTLNTTTGKWQPPIEQPTTLTDEQLEAFIYYKWDESAYQADNTTGWILNTP